MVFRVLEVSFPTGQDITCPYGLNVAVSHGITAFRLYRGSIDRQAIATGTSGLDTSNVQCGSGRRKQKNGFGLHGLEEIFNHLLLT
jgi:hypothetical protein